MCRSVWVCACGCVWVRACARVCVCTRSYACVRLCLDCYKPALAIVLRRLEERLRCFQGLPLVLLVHSVSLSEALIWLSLLSIRIKSFFQEKHVR